MDSSALVTLVVLAGILAGLVVTCLGNAVIKKYLSRQSTLEQFRDDLNRTRENSPSPLSKAILQQTQAWREKQKSAPAVGPDALPIDFDPSEELLKLNPYLPRKAKMPVLDDNIPTVGVEMTCSRIEALLQSAAGKEFTEPQVIRMMLVPGDEAMKAALAPGRLTIIIDAGDKADLASAKKQTEETTDQIMNPGVAATSLRR